MTFNGFSFDLAELFYEYREGLTGGFQYDRLTKYVANDYWNQYRTGYRVIPASLQGLETTGDLPEIPDMLHRYVFQDMDYETANRWFMIVGMPGQNYRECSWNATFAEVYGLEAGYEYDDTKHEYKLLT